MTHVTRLGLSATPRSLYGSFAGKTEDVLTELERIVILEQSVKDLEALFFADIILP